VGFHSSAFTVYAGERRVSASTDEIQQLFTEIWQKLIEKILLVFKVIVESAFCHVGTRHDFVYGGRGVTFFTYYLNRGVEQAAPRLFRFIRTGFLNLYHEARVPLRSLVRLLIGDQGL